MNIYEAITAIMSEGYAITKEKKNTQQGFLYRGIDDVMNTFFPLLSKYKVFVVPEVLEEHRNERTSKEGKALLYSILRIRYTFFAEDGSSVSAVVIGEGMDSGDKASNKAMAVAMKYAFFQVFCVPTEEMPDPDAESPSVTPQKPTRATEQIYTCDLCGAKIDAYTGMSGRTITPALHAAATKKKFGKVLCLDCIDAERNKSDENPV